MQSENAGILLIKFRCNPALNNQIDGKAATLGLRFLKRGNSMYEIWVIERKEITGDWLLYETWPTEEDADRHLALISWKIAKFRKRRFVPDR